MTIKIYDAVYEPTILYRRASTSAQRALVGYMIKAGLASDPVLGGAFNVLKGIETCMQNKEIYTLYSFVDNETKKKILHIVQIALDGKLDRFAITDKERITILNQLCQPI